MPKTDLLTQFGPLAHFDPNYLHLAVAALAFGVVMATARGFFGKLIGVAMLALCAWAVGMHNWNLLYAVAGGGLLVSMVLSGGARRARA